MPYADTWEDQRRRHRIIWLGVLLVLAFAIPRVEIPPRQSSAVVRLPNLDAIVRADMPLLTRLSAAYPAVAGVLVILVALLGAATGRALILLLLAAVPLALSALGENPFEVAPGAPDAAAALRSPVFALLLAGWTAILAGSRAMHYRPQPPTARGLAAAGAALWAIAIAASLKTPSGPGIELALPSITIPAHETGTWLRTGLLASLVLGSAAALLSLAAPFLRRSGPGTWASRLAALSIVALMLASFAQLHESLFSGTAVPAELIPGAILDRARCIAWCAAFALLIPVALADLLISVADVNVADAVPQRQPKPMPRPVRPRRTPDRPRQKPDDDKDRLPELRDMLATGFVPPDAATPEPEHRTSRDEKEDDTERDAAVEHP